MPNDLTDATPAASLATRVKIHKAKTHKSKKIQCFKGRVTDREVQVNKYRKQATGRSTKNPV